MQEVIRLRQQQQVGAGRAGPLAQGRRCRPGQKGGRSASAILFMTHSTAAPGAEHELAGGFWPLPDCLQPTSQLAGALPTTRVKLRTQSRCARIPGCPPQPWFPAPPACPAQDSSDQLLDLQERLELQEQRQQQMIGFLATALQHPGLVQHLVASTPIIKRIDDGRSERRCLPARLPPGTGSCRRCRLTAACLLRCSPALPSQLPGVARGGCAQEGRADAGALPPACLQGARSARAPRARAATATAWTRPSTRARRWRWRSRSRAWLTWRRPSCPC